MLLRPHIFFQWKDAGWECFSFSTAGAIWVCLTQGEYNSALTLPVSVTVPVSNLLLSPHAPKHFSSMTRPIPKHLTESLFDLTPQLRSISAPEQESSLHYLQWQSFRCLCDLFGRLNFDSQGNVLKPTLPVPLTYAHQYGTMCNRTWPDLNQVLQLHLSHHLLLIHDLTHDS